MAKEVSSASAAPSDAGEYQLFDTYSGHTDAISSVAFSPDGKFLASSSNDKTARIWDMKTGQTVQTISGHTGGLSDVAWAPDSQTVATASDDYTVRLWEAGSGKHVRTFTGHTNYVMCVNFNPQGTLLASGSYDNTVRIWDVATGKSLHRLPAHTEQVVSVHFNPDGTKLVTAGFDGLVRVWDASNGHLLRNFVVADQGVPVCFAKWSPNAKYFLVGSYDGTWKLLNAKTGLAARTYVGHTFNEYCILGAFSLTRGKWIISGSADNTVCIWDINTKELIQQLKGHNDVVVAVSAHPSQDVIASGALGKDCSIKLWKPTKPTGAEDAPESSSK
jgi:COMPASS component SWD3